MTARKSCPSLIASREKKAFSRWYGKFSARLSKGRFQDSEMEGIKASFVLHNSLREADGETLIAECC
jgi:hypothetical protein